MGEPVLAPAPQYFHKLTANESHTRFIESYVDPQGARAEWEGFVAVVNVRSSLLLYPPSRLASTYAPSIPDLQKEQSKKFNTLVDAAPDLIKTLPWGPDFEVAKFQRPDFTALEILSFATAGIPAGIS